MVKEVKNALTKTTTKTTTTTHANKNHMDQQVLEPVISDATHTKNKEQKTKKEKEKEKPANEDENGDDDEFGSMRDEINEYFAKKNQKLLLKGVDNKAIESTMRFKYIRSLEALFESTPQSVLQLVYLMRTSEFAINGNNDDDKTNAIIIIISICQSILSMTNSMLASDNAYMSREKFKDYKKRLPPSFKFLKHFLVRLSEISCRVGLFALFWTVVGGDAFVLLLIWEMLFPLLLVKEMLDDNTFEWREAFLSFNMVCAHANYL